MLVIGAITILIVIAGSVIIDFNKLKLVCIHIIQILFGKCKISIKKISSIPLILKFQILEEQENVLLEKLMKVVHRIIIVD